MVDIDLKMEDLERRIIKRKKGAFMEHLQITEGFLDELRVKQIFTSDVIDSIATEKINGARVTKLLDNVLSMQEPYETIAAILLKDHSWLTRDMEAEILAERGTLEIDEDLLRETGMMVHRKFGSSKRLCESDKREIQELMALKLQIAKGEFKQEVGKVKEDLNKQTQINIASEKRAAKMLQTTKKFLKERDSQLTTHAHGLLTTKNVLHLSMAEMAYSSLEKFENYSEYVLLKFGNILNQKDILLDEREKCLKILKIDNDNDLPLDEIFRNYKEKEAQKIQTMEKKVSAPSQNNSTSNGTDSAYVMKRLNSKISDMEMALDEKDEKIRELEEQVEKLKNVKLTTLHEESPMNGSTEDKVNDNVETKRRSSTGNVRKKTATKRGSVPNLSKPMK